MVLSYLLIIAPTPMSTLFPYTTLFRSETALRQPSLDLLQKRGGIGPAPAFERFSIEQSEPFGKLFANGISVFRPDRKSTRLNSSHANISYAVFCLKKKKSKLTLRL